MCYEFTEGLGTTIVFLEASDPILINPFNGRAYYLLRLTMFVEEFVLVNDILSCFIKYYSIIFIFLYLFNI